MFGMIVERLLVPDAQKISGRIERKITAVGLIKLLSESLQLTESPYSQHWYIYQQLYLLFFSSALILYQLNIF
jgi:exportin-2 (importin alpha re-exporter)